MSGWLALAATLVVIGGVADAPGLIVVAAITAGYGTLTRLWTRYGVRNVTYERRLGAPRLAGRESAACGIHR